MIKKGLVLTFLFSTLFSFAQDATVTATTSNPKHEIKVNGVMLILGAAEVDYQYLLNEASGIGIDVLYSFDNLDLNLNYAISPYFRQYFGKSYASGFFVEGFAMLNSTDDYIYSETYDSSTDTFTYTDYYDEDLKDVAIGIATGAKFVTKRGFAVEIDFGLGRNLLQNNRDAVIIAKGGINLGYRF